MKKIKLLDCTLRDGGYTNDWNFGHSTMLNVIEHLISSRVDFIELGFLDERRPFDINRSIFPDTKSANEMFGMIEKKNSLFLGMIDYGTCKIGNIQPASESVFDGIRVIFKKHLMHEALAFCAEIKALGYKVFAQLVSITSYDDKELLELISLVNEVEPYAVSMVDTYGLLLPKELLHYYSILDKHIKANIAIGFHAHNNFQMAYANDRAFLEKQDCNPERTILCDGTLYGMGKSAGNTPIEILAMTLNNEYGYNFEINHLLEAINTNILQCYQTSPWGYNWFFYMSALNRCHPNYLTTFLSKDNMTWTNLNGLLSKPEGDKKLLFDKAVAEEIYKEYEDNVIDDSKAVAEISRTLNGRTLLLVGPGKNIQLQKDAVVDFINKEKPFIISTNFIPGGFNVDCVFVTNFGRYVRMADSLYEIRNREIKIIATSNIASSGKPFDFCVAQKPLLETNSEIKDNSFLMLLRLLVKAGIQKVVCAGFDGYSSTEDNYFNTKMEYDFVKSSAKSLNNHIRDEIELLDKNISLSFLTYSYYAEKEDINAASI